MSKPRDREIIAVVAGEVAAELQGVAIATAMSLPNGMPRLVEGSHMSDNNSATLAKTTGVGFMTEVCEIVSPGILATQHIACVLDHEHHKHCYNITSIWTISELRNFIGLLTEKCNEATLMTRTKSD